MASVFSTASSMIHPYHSSTCCPITQLKVQPYQRQSSITHYPINIKYYNNALYSFEIKYTYEEFVQFSKVLHQHFKIPKRDLPILKKDHHQFFQHLLLKRRGEEEDQQDNYHHQKYIDRQNELEKFCEKLLGLPSIITCSNLFLDFFSSFERGKQQQLLTTIGSSSSIINLKLKRLFSSGKKQQQHEESFLPPSFSRMIVLSNMSLTQYNQHEHYKKKNYVSMMSTPNTTSSSKRNSASDDSFSSSFSSSAEEEPSLIKLKIVYDWSNIIIIRVPRSISLDQLRSQVIQKFALLNIQLPDQLALLATKKSPLFSSSPTSSLFLCSAAAAAIDNNSLLLEEDPSLIILISEEQDLVKAMQTIWSNLEKVTLRCVL